MTYSPESSPRKRAPRAILQSTLPATVRLENGRHLPANLRQVSRNGGLLELKTCLDERAKVRLTLPFDSGSVSPRAEMLFPIPGTRGCLQPFRFTGLRDDEALVIEREIAEILRQSLGPAKKGLRLGSRPSQPFLESF